MIKNRVSSELSATKQKTLLDLIEQIKKGLPFLIDLSKEERQSLPKMGDKTRAFVQKALDVAAQNPSFLPRSFDVDEMRKDVELFEALQPLRLAMAQLLELIEDTSIEVGCEAYLAALTVYQSAKNGGQGEALDGLVDSMAKRFARKAILKKDQ